MAMNFDALGERMFAGLFVEADPVKDLVIRLGTDRLKDNESKRDIRNIKFVDKLDRKIQKATRADGSSSLDVDTLAGYRRMIKKYSS
jgi:hypothetical protein